MMYLAPYRYMESGPQVQGLVQCRTYGKGRGRAYGKTDPCSNDGGVKNGQPSPLRAIYHEVTLANRLSYSSTQKREKKKRDEWGFLGISVRWRVQVKVK